MPKNTAPLPEFHGWDAPHYTPIPDQLFDEWLPHLSGAELKVLLYIMRRTFGFKKHSDAISLAQITDGIVRRDGERLDSGAGVVESTALIALKGLLAKGLILAERQLNPDGGYAPTVYCLHMAGPLPENRGRGSREVPRKSGRGSHENRGGGSARTGEGLPQNPGRQETVVQETVKQETEDSNPLSPEKIEKRDETGKHRGGEGKPPYSPYIAGVIMDFSRELDDSTHGPSNVTQALRLWADSGLADEAFVQQCYAAKRLLRQAQAHGVANKMAYFFVVLRRALAIPDESAA